jgi:hypothetical protein
VSRNCVINFAYEPSDSRDLYFNSSTRIMLLPKIVSFNRPSVKYMNHVVDIAVQSDGHTPSWIELARALPATEMEGETDRQTDRCRTRAHQRERGVRVRAGVDIHKISNGLEQESKIERAKKIDGRYSAIEVPRRCRCIVAKTGRYTRCLPSMRASIASSILKKKYGTWRQRHLMLLCKQYSIS